MADKWYKTGNDGVEEGAKKDAQAKARADQRENRRFWQQKDASAKIIFIDTPAFFFSEHNLEISGHFGNFFTCLNDFDECPLCLDGDNPRYVVAGTIIDTSSYEGKDGNVYKNQKKLFVALGEARKNTLKQAAKRDGDLSYCIYELSRGSATTDPNTGRDFEFIKKTSRASIGKWLAAQWTKEGKEFKKSDIEKFLTPFDYAKIFAPKSAAELRKLVGMATPIGGAEEIPEDAEKIDGDSEPGSLDDLL